LTKKSTNNGGGWLKPDGWVGAYRLGYRLNNALVPRFEKIVVVFTVLPFHVQIAFLPRDVVESAVLDGTNAFVHLYVCLLNCVKTCSRVTTTSCITCQASGHHRQRR